MKPVVNKPATAAVYSPLKRFVKVNPVFVVGIAASAGGLNAISHVVRSLEPSINAAIVVVQHLAPGHPSHLSAIFQKRTPLPVKQAEDGDLLEPGHIYVAPPNRHLVVTRARTLRLTDDPRVGYLRPSANVLFESIARHVGRQGICVVLSGTGSDGAEGVIAVKAKGGIVVVQEPTEAEFTGMPSAAAASGAANCVLTLDDIGPYLMKVGV